MYSIDPDIRRSHTLPGSFYRDANAFDAVRERVLTRCWHYVADATDLPDPSYVWPWLLLPAVLDEPLLLTRDRTGTLHCLSNVCTHRGNVLALEPGPVRLLRCNYHGRCFGHDGTFRSMPAFEEAADFPGPEDHLPRLPLADWNGLLFTSLDARVSWDEIMQPINERLSWLPLDKLTFDPESSRDFMVEANWALYVDNYLEGLHIPFVHPALNQAIDFPAYKYELYPYVNLQLGIAKEGEAHFPMPPGGHVDEGKLIYAYYYWVFPNLMFNFYPWGLSLNVVEPLGQSRTRVRFRTYYYPDQPFNRTVNVIEQTEFEDEAVVEQVQRGIQSRLYRRGRFSPSMEPAVHHFHQLISDWLK